MSGDEVSKRVTQGMVAELLRFGVDIPRLLRGMPFNAAQLSDPSGRIGWDDWIELLDRIRDALGGSLALADFFGRTVQFSPEMRAIGSLVLSPRRLYLSVAERVARGLFGIVACRIGEVPDGRIWSEVTVPPRCRDSTSFHYSTLGALKAYPRLVGAADAAVEMELSSHRALYYIEVPESHTLVARAAHLLRSPLDWMARAHPLGIEPTHDHVLRGMTMAFDESVERARALACGEQLAVARDAHELVRRFSAYLEDNFGCGHVALWARSSGGAWLDPVALPAEPNRVSARRMVPITLDGQEIGQVEVDVPQLSLGVPVPLFAAVMPWLAVGLARCVRSGDTTGALRTRSERAAVTFKLSPRQAEALELLAAGASNKDIAKAMGTSVKTIEAHVSGILRKAGVESRAALVAKVWSSDA